MINIQTIQHVADCVPLYLPHSLYIKPVARMKISVALPSHKTGKSISNLDIMEKLSLALRPDKFLVLKVSKSTIDFIRFEAELDDRSRLRSALNRLDGIFLKISGFHDGFRVRASESKDDFPTRHDWDSFFRDAHNMDEMKAGERPDTIHLSHFPIKWFCPRHMENEDNVKPSESIFKRIFEKFGSVRCVDIPICDPFRSKMNADINGMKTFSFEQDVLFEAYVQFDEYVGFVRAMDEFRSMKLVRKFVDKTQAINIIVNFDTSKHLSDAQMQRRERVRKRLIAKAKAEEEEIEKQKKLELERLERQRQQEEQAKLEELEKQKEREEKRKEKHLKRIQEKGQIEISQKIRVEGKKLMITQRKLESIRILEKLFDRMKLKHMAKLHTSTSSRKYMLDMQRDTLRERLVEKYKVATEKLLNDQRKKVDDIKSNTPIMGLLKSKKSKLGSDSENENNKSSLATSLAPGTATTATTEGLNSLNPFKTMAAMGAAASYNSEAASEWMKSLSIFPYASSMFPGLGMYRPQTFPVSVNYRGFAPRIRGRGRGRGRARGSYDGQPLSSSYYNSHKYYNNHDDRDHRYDDEEGGSGSYHKYSRGRYYSRSRSRDRRSRSRSRSRSSSRSRSRRSRSRQRGRSRHYSKRSRSRTRSHSHSYSRSESRSRSRSRVRSRDDKSRKTSRSKSPQGNVQHKPLEKINKKLASTRRSRSPSDWSRSRSRSQSRSKRSWSKRGSSKERRSSPSRKVIIETDELVKSAEEIKRTIEKGMQDRMREEEREIKETFNKRHKQVLAHNAVLAENLLAAGIDSGIGTAEHSAAESSLANSSTQEKEETKRNDHCNHDNEYENESNEDEERTHTKKSRFDRRNSTVDRQRSSPTSSSRRNSREQRYKSRHNSFCERSPMRRRNSLERQNSSPRRTPSRPNSSERECSN